MAAALIVAATALSLTAVPWSSSAAAGDPVAPNETPVVMVHGYSGADCPGSDITRAVWGGVYQWLEGVIYAGPGISRWDTSLLLPVSFYACDTDGVDITGYGPTVPDGASPTVTPDNPRVKYTADTSIEQLAHDLAWFVYDTFSSVDMPVDLVGSSMGGLVIRDALYLSGRDATFPPYLIAPRAVTLSTPHDGYLTQATIGTFCHTVTVECDEFAGGSPFMTELIANAPSPQGRDGTAWTVAGSSEGCDFIPAASTLDMPEAQRIDYQAPCYGHVDYLWDYGTTTDAAMSVTPAGADASLTDGAAPRSLMWVTEVLGDSFVPVETPRPSTTPTSASPTPTPTSVQPSQPPPDLSAPTPRVVSPAGLFQAATSIRVAYAATDTESGVAHYDVRYRVAAWNRGFGSFQYPATWQRRTTTSLTLTGTRGSEYCFSVRATDRAGNTSGWTTQRCVAVPLDERSLAVIKPGWRRESSTAAYAGTLMRTAHRGARLRLRDAHTDRIALVVVECPQCGRISIALGGVHWRTVSTYAATVRHKVILIEPRFASRIASVALTDSDARPIVIDGLAIAHN